MTTKAKSIKSSDKWLDLARMHSKNVRPELETILSTTTLAYGTDGYRAHRVHGQYTATNHNSPQLIARIEHQFTLARDTQCEVTVKADQLAQAVKQCRAFRHGIDQFGIRLKATTDGLHLSARNAEYGDCETSLVDGDTIPHWRNDPKYKTIPLPRNYPETVIYRHSGPDVEMGINPKFLLDALAGMGETATIRLRSDMIDLVSEDGEREAVVMGMHLGH